jgi:hypothetical protein
MNKLVFLAMFGIFSSITESGMADSSHPMTSANAQSTCDTVVQQKVLELFDQQKKNNAESHERELKNFQSTEQLQKLKLQAQTEQMQSHERYVKDLQRIEDDNARYRKILAAQEANNVHFDKILSTWDRQQQQYQQYLDRLKH